MKINFRIGDFVIVKLKENNDYFLTRIKYHLSVDHFYVICIRKLTNKGNNKCGLKSIPTLEYWVWRSEIISIKYGNYYEEDFLNEFPEYII